MPFYALLQSLVAGVLWVRWTLTFVLVTGIALQLAFLANDLELFERRNHLPALLFPVLLGLLPRGANLDPALAGMPLLLWAIRCAWLARGRTASAPLFDSGALIGLAALFHLPYAFMLVVISASNAVMRSFQWRDHVVPLIGLLTVMLLCRGGLFVLQLDAWHPLPTLITPTDGWGRLPAGYVYLLLTVLGLFSIPAAISFAAGYARSVVHGKNLRSAWLAFGLACSVLIGFSMLLTGVIAAVLAAAPLALFLAYPLLQPRRPWMAEAVVLLLAAMALWSQWALGLSSAA